jgi:hypothetical protein
MAILIPSLGFARFDSRGELRLAERLKDFLEENAVVWHNLPVGPRSRHPDFIIVHPANGLLVLEVKDWRLESIAAADKTKVELLTSRGIVRESSPLEQARKYAFEVVRTLERDGQLLFSSWSSLHGATHSSVRLRGRIHEYHAQAVRSDQSQGGVRRASMCIQG